mgnify:CR=1 FL=1
MDQVTMRPIGVIHSPYKEMTGIPIQGSFNDEVEAWVELEDEYAAGLKDLDGFSHAVLIYHFHKSRREEIEGRPFLEQQKHGIFAIRSPHRPNRIGLSVVRIKSIADNRIHFTQVDVLDGTPLLDIKPYVKYFDSRENVICGWLDKHFADGKIPDGVIMK